MSRPDFLDSSLLHPVWTGHLPTAPRPDTSRDLTARDIAEQLANLGPDEE